MKIFIFGNPDIEEDSLPVKLMPQLKKQVPNFDFVHLDPNEEWGEIPEHFVMIDTVQGIDGVMVFNDLEKIEQTPLVSLHDFDVVANLKWLKKLGTIKKITIIGVPTGGMDVNDIAESINNILINLRM
ncbi:MAG: hypothetical protein A3H59_02965 [Candidatus Jacksonbacteria bacterium RIFCSPLOWO2_02_FULL_43_9]|nr:MAG: hypothetical protein UV70_C0003G0054 [Parcubacteria group bacterium GW2011_GWA2_43_13]OGY69362.1 MAG: hypothetical protein A3B94_03555 [Candidatus Jacksonbacteria bacterium RIFCSPHIGHO2_02_FULL_43_10]OGY70581.1 MAG: hypothetical protein A2986_02635 [Candidatus Jacksonbacteria bacterium RIFCSPLOWO2_01_FULL_44_13]OGY74162.1 MAG: hypothetical protein A3H59_02965 [Candidatus Jacksonbacteria bacterium RIFCSPLOWO2_02_FULL_43_9]HAZ16359.1 hypothetical protein [Candidatus Jacksonbacteria bacter